METFPERDVWSVISGFRREVAENSTLLGYYAVSSDNFLPTFRNNLSVPSSAIKNLKRNPQPQYRVYTGKSVGSENVSVLWCHFGAESFVFQFDIWKFKNQDIENYNFARCFVWMWNLVADIWGGT